MMENDFKIQDNGEIEVQISPIGEFNGSDAKGDAVPESITKESLDNLADKLNQSGDEVLVDVDHASVRPGLDRDTRAVGWLSKFFTTVKGLFAKMRLTGRGKELVENREFRYLSPVFTLSDKGEPLELHSVAFTNTPAFAGSIKPIVNHEANNKSEDKGTISMEMTKDELIDLIKNTVKAMNEEASEQTEEKEEVKTEETVEAENACSEEKEEVKNSETETKTEDEVKEEVKEEVAEETKPEEVEEKKEEVIKIETLNSAPTIMKDVSGKDAWMNLRGDAFWKYLREHPEIKG